MKLPKFDFIEPESIEECCKLLMDQKGKAQVIAGGTDLLMALKYRLKDPATLLDLSRMDALKNISYSDKDGLRVGAMVTLRQLANNSIVRGKYPFITRAALTIGDAQLQAMGTIGGNLCQDSCCHYFNRQPMWRQNLDACHKLGGSVCHAVKGSKICWATYCGDLAPVLLVLQGHIKVAAVHDEKIIPLNELFSGDGKNPLTLSPGQLITEIHLPPLDPPVGGAYRKMRVRKAIDYPLLGVAACVTLNKDNHHIKNILTALTGVEKSPILVTGESEIEEGSRDELIEKLAESAYQQAHPINNTYGFSPKYRREMVKIYVKSAIQESIAYAINKGGTA